MKLVSILYAQLWKTKHKTIFKIFLKFEQIQAEIIQGLKSAWRNHQISETHFFLVYLTTNLCSFACQNLCPYDFSLTFQRLLNVSFFENTGYIGSHDKLDNVWRNHQNSIMYLSRLILVIESPVIKFQSPHFYLFCDRITHFVDPKCIRPIPYKEKPNSLNINHIRPHF